MNSCYIVYFYMFSSYLAISLITAFNHVNNWSSIIVAAHQIKRKDNPKIFFDINKQNIVKPNSLKICASICIF